MTDDIPEGFEQRIVCAAPGMDQVHAAVAQTYKTVGDLALQYDIYYPADQRDGQLRPAVVFVHGEAPQLLLRHAKNWGQYVSWGQLIAATGLIAVIFNHRSSDFFRNLEPVAEDIEDFFAHLREQAAGLGIDGERLGMWVCSGGTPPGARFALRAGQPWLRCWAALYGRLSLDGLREQLGAAVSEETLAEYSPVRHLVGRETPGELAPFLLARAGQDRLPHVNESIDQFVQAALACNAPFELLNHPAGDHGFDIVNDDDRSRLIIRRIAAFFAEHLQATEDIP